MAKKSAKSASRKAPNRDVERTVLDNGVRVITEKVRNAASVGVGVWVDAGSRYEELKESGATHLLQRIALHGTANRSEAKIAKALDAVGGDVEYQTGRDFACWLARVEPKNLPSTLDLLGDLTLNPKVSKTAIAAEQKILLEELKADEKDPDFDLERMFLRSLWKTNGLCRPPRGRVLVVKDKARLDDFKPKSIERFHRETHHPKALTIVLAGDLEHAKAQAAATKVFGDLEMPKKTVGTITPTPFRFMAMRSKPKMDDVRMQLGVPACGASDERRHEARLLNSLIGRGADSRLARLIREGGLEVEEAYSTLDMFGDVGLLSVRLHVGRKHAAESVETVVAELRKLTGLPVEEDELDRAKAQVRAAMLGAVDSVKTRVEDLAAKERYFGRVVPTKDEIEEIESVTPEQVRMLATEWIAPHYLSLAVLGNLKGVNIKPKALHW